ncbi:MAG: response regulator [bacterium]|nr:response regulator [bacterium]
MPAKIFIIDDDKELCEEVIEIMRDEGYLISAEYDGLKGKEAVEKGGYDLLLLDLKLPGLSGFDVLKQIREKNIRIKVIIVSGRPQYNGLFNENAVCKNKDKEEEEILKLADGIISKPFEIKIMLNKIKELLT